MQRFLNLLVLSALLLTVAVGCGGGGANKPVTLQVWTGFPEVEPFYKAAGEAYTKLHPNVKVETLSTTLREMEQKLSAAVPTGTGPDIYDCGPNIIAKFIDSKLVGPNPPEIDTLLKSGIYPQVAVDYMIYDGKSYGLPIWEGSHAALLYNKTMFKEAGLDPENPPATFDELMEDAKQLTKYDADGNITISGLSLRLSGQGSGITEKFGFILYPMGGSIIEPTKDGTKWHNGYDNEAGVKALTYYVDAVQKYHVDTPEVPHDSDAFVGETTAMFLRESWVIGEVASKNPDLEYGSAPMPKDKQFMTLSQPWGIYVDKSSKNTDVAWDFVKFMTNQENSRLLTQMSGWVSLRTDVDWAPLTDRTPQWKVFLTPPKEIGYWAYPRIACFDEIMTKMADRLTASYIDKTLLDNPDAVAAKLHEMAVETDQILKDNGLYGTD